MHIISDYHGLKTRHESGESIGSMCKYCVHGGILLYPTLTAAEKMQTVNVLVNSLHAAVLSLFYGLYSATTWEGMNLGILRCPTNKDIKKKIVVPETHLHSKKCVNVFTFAKVLILCLYLSTTTRFMVGFIN